MGVTRRNLPKAELSLAPRSRALSLSHPLPPLSGPRALVVSPRQVVIGTKVGRAKHQRVMPGGTLEGEQQRLGGKSRSTSSSGLTSYFVGRKLDEHRGAFLLEYPMERGRVVDGGWDAMELLWEVSANY